MTERRPFFRLAVRRRAAARDEMREELAFHLQARIDQLVARGVSPADARDEALRRLGVPLEQAETELGTSAELKEQRMDMHERLDNVADDIRFAVRGLIRQPAFTAVAVLTLAIGIGANTALYTAVDAMLLRALPFAEPDRLMDISLVSPDEGPTEWSWPKFTAFREGQRSYASLALHRASTATLTGADPERITIESVTAQYLSALGVHVARGHDLPAELDAGPNARKVALISDALWQRRFAADPDVAGKIVHIDSDAYEVVGVLPPAFRGLSGKAQALIPITARKADDLGEPWSLEFNLIGRLRAGVSQAQAIAEARALGPRVYEAFPVAKGTLTSSKGLTWGAMARPLDTIRVASGLRRALLVLLGAVGMVLLIACVNLANLQLGRATVRRQEIAVRLAIGASRTRLVRLLLVESSIVALLGGVASLVVAWGGTRILRSINPEETLRVQNLAGLGAVNFESIHLDPAALVFTLVVTLAVGMLFGLAPAILATQSNLVQDLKDGGAGSGQARRTGASRRSLVVAEVALALVLLVGAGLMVRSLGNLLAVNPGFDAEHVLTLRMSIPPGAVAPDSMPGFYERVQETIAALPGVESVALADCPPLNGGCNGTLMTFPDRPLTATGNAIVGVHWVSPSWFRTMRVPLTRGRLFGAEDRAGSPKVLVINAEAARKYFPGQDPLGRVVRVYQGGFHTGATIIGVVGDVRFGTIDSTARPDVYISYGQGRTSNMLIFARTTGAPTALTPGIRARLHDIAPLDPVYDVRTMAERVGTASAQARFSATLLAMFAAVALALAVMGIYAVLSFAVAQRTREIGIRMALGADRRSVLALIVRDGALLAAAGLAIGLGAAWALSRVLTTMLFDVAPADPATYAAIVVILAGAALLASWLPARRAASVDPVTALRRG